MKYLYKSEDTVFAECVECKRILKFKEYQLSEVKEGIECFCGNTSNTIDGMPTEKTINNHTSEVMSVYDEIVRQPRIKCPTCGSTNVQKISLTSKVVGGAMVGLFSSDVRNTFKCENCGYKW